MKIIYNTQKGYTHVYVCVCVCVKQMGFLNSFYSNKTFKIKSGLNLYKAVFNELFQNQSSPSCCGCTEPGWPLLMPPEVNNSAPELTVVEKKILS